MILDKVRIKGFQSFGEKTEFDLKSITYVLGPNGSGKTAFLQALSRMFAYESALRKLKKSDFFVNDDEIEERSLWVEADFSFPELVEEGLDTSGVPPNFNHMSMFEVEGVPVVRFRLSATLFPDGEIEEELVYVIAVDEHNQPISTSKVSRADRNNIQLHYLPALRDPNNHISYTANSYLGRVLKAIDWDGQKDHVHELTEQVSTTLMSNDSIESFSENLNVVWKRLHKGYFYSDLHINFIAHEIEALLKNLSISFSDAPGEGEVEYTRLSDGQKSLLYLTIVFSIHQLSRRMVKGEETGLNFEKFKPPIFTLLAIEEPENSLSPHYLGRIKNISKEMVEAGGAQVFVATHSPSIVKRVDPRSIRFFRLDEKRITQVKKVRLPEEGTEEQKYVQEAIQAFPELYFSKLIVFGEGDSEEIVIPRLLKAFDQDLDEGSISVVPLGGRHVNHFWRLCDELGIPHVTLLDFDLARYGGGWGRIKVVCDQFMKNTPPEGLVQGNIDMLPKWDENNFRMDKNSPGWLDFLESSGVFFSFPLDLDFSMIKQFSNKYGIDVDNQIAPDVDDINIVLGMSHAEVNQYDDNEKILFKSYKTLFKSRGKPTSHIAGLSEISDQELKDNAPPELKRLVDFIFKKLREVSE